MVKRYNRAVVALAGASDILTAVAAWTIGYFVRYLGGLAGLTHHPLPPFSQFAMPMVLSLVLLILVFSRLDLYGPKRTKSLLAESGQLVRAVCIVWGVTYVMTNFSREVTVSRLMMASVLAVWLPLGIATRLTGRALLAWFRRRGKNLHMAAIAGTGRLAQKVYQGLLRNRWTGIQPAYFVDNHSVGQTLSGLEVLGPFEKIDQVIAGRPVDIVFVALRRERHEDIKEILDRLATTAADVRFVPDLKSSYVLGHDVSVLEGLPVISMTHSPQHGWDALLKRTFDLVAAAVGIALLAVPMGIVALIVKLTSPGPVFYRQWRAGLGGKRFRIIKFRTMVENAEKHTGPIWATSHDPRATRFGRFLRRTSLDELPQLFNVFLGQMSLVGPRPERPELIERFRKQIPRYMLRHQVRAGLTGWAQANGFRGRTSLRKRLQYDLHYIRKWSFALDLRILLMTVFGGSARRAARRERRVALPGP